MSYTKTIVVGHIGQDAKISEHNGKKVVSFSVAHSEKWKDKDDVEHSKTTWFSCSLWKGENRAPYLKKGTLVLCEGQISASAYSDKEGEEKADLKLNVRNLVLLGGKKEKSSKDNAEITDSLEGSGKDLPF